MARRQCAALGVLIGSGLILGAVQQDTAERRSDDVYQPPKQPLDPRIDPTKVTEADPPPLPQQLILPMPPQFRIAQRPEQVPISRAHWDNANQAIARGLAFLRSAQNIRGGWLTSAQAAPTDEPDKPSPIAVTVTALANVQYPVPSVVTTFVERKAVSGYHHEEGEKAVASAKAKLETANISHQVHIGVGKPGETIVHFAKDFGCGAIVMGTRGLGGTAGLLLGSVTRDVKAEADIPITLIK